MRREQGPLPSDNLPSKQGLNFVLHLLGASLWLPDRFPYHLLQ